ncbi:MAG: hypothetical protein HZA90_10605 [Verrucomicrobia bacterium]|nr:hypothetical protein [Verrucomicrobiota bacterium]
MKTIKTVQVDEALTFFVETTDDQLAPTLDSRQDLPPGARPTGKFTDVFSSMARTIQAAVKFVLAGFVQANRPDELTVEFSVALKGEAAIPVVVSGATEGTFKVSAMWKNPTESSK